MKNDVFGGFLLGCMLTAVMFILFAANFMSWNSDIYSGKNFIIKNETHRCEKTNELKVDEN